MKYFVERKKVICVTVSIISSLLLVVGSFHILIRLLDMSQNFGANWEGKPKEIDNLSIQYN